MAKSADRAALIGLRVVAARVAQHFGLDALIPGNTSGETGLSFDVLRELANRHERGWNNLLFRVQRQQELQEPAGHRRWHCPATRGLLCHGNRGDW